MKTPTHRSTLRQRRDPAGIALVQVIILGAALFGLAAAALVLSRDDVMISNNIVTGTKAFWIAAGGTEFGKNWLESNYTNACLDNDPPCSFGPNNVGDGTYTVTLARFAPLDPRIRIRSEGVTTVGSGNARKVVEEIVSVPIFNGNGGLVQIDGAAIPSDLEDPGNGPGLRIPSWTMDGQGYHSDGTVDPACAPAPPVGGVPDGSETGLPNELDNLRCKIVQRANECCVPPDPANNLGWRTSDIQETYPGLCVPGTCSDLTTCLPGACTVNVDNCSAGTCSGGNCVAGTCNVDPSTCVVGGCAEGNTNCTTGYCGVATCTPGTCSDGNCAAGTCAVGTCTPDVTCAPNDPTCVPGTCNSQGRSCTPGGTCNGQNCTVASCAVGSCTAGTCDNNRCTAGTCPITSCGLGSCPAGSTCVAGSCPVSGCAPGDSCAGTCIAASCPATCVEGDCPQDATNCISGTCGLPQYVQHCPSQLCESEPGLWAVRGTGAEPLYDSPYWTDINHLDGTNTPPPEWASWATDCNAEVDGCCKRMSLSPADLRPTAPSNNLIPRGPLTSDTPERSDEFPVKSMTESEIDALQQLIQTVLDGALDAPVGRKVCITDQFIRGGTYIHGDLTNPKIVIVSAPNDQNAKVRALSTQPPCTTGPGDGVNNLVIENGAVFQGAGVLILPRELDIKDATFDWKGLVLIMENGKIVALKDACGGICGGLLLQTSNDRNNARLDFDKNEARSTCGAANGAFSLSRCCDALDITIRILTHTLSWTERFEG